MFRSKKECSICPVVEGESKQAFIFIHRDLKAEIQEAINLYPDEFMLVLLGKKIHDRAYLVESYEVPKQYVSSAYCEARETILFKDDKIGFFHSHHSMGAFHSGTDQDGVDNAPVSVVGSTTNWTGKATITLPCGFRAKAEARIVVYDNEEDIKIPDLNEVTTSRIRCSAGDFPCGLVRKNRIICELEDKAEKYVHYWKGYPYGDLYGRMTPHKGRAYERYFEDDEMLDEFPSNFKRRAQFVEKRPLKNEKLKRTTKKKGKKLKKNK